MDIVCKLETKSEKLDEEKICEQLEDCSTMPANVQLTADVDSLSVSGEIPIESIEGLKQIPSVIILRTAGSTGTGNNIDVKDSVLERSSKRFCMETVDGQSYVFTMPDTPSDGSEMEQLNDTGSFPPANKEHGENTDLHVSQAWFTSRDDKTALQFQGQTWRQGQWSKEEVALLQLNITNYCKEHNFLDPADIIFGLSKDERKDFYRIVAKGLNRPLFSVYRRVIRMYDKKNYIGKYTPVEVKKLIELRKKHGSDWAAIGAAMGRSASSVKDRCRLLRDTCNTGKWFPDEEKRLGNAVYEQTGLRPGENITSGVSWAAIAELVGTRTEKQCRTKWLNYLNWKQKGGTDWTRDDDNALINRIESLNVKCENDIDWTKLSKGWESVRSPQWLRGKWWSLKKHIQNYGELTFPDAVAVLKQCQDSNCHRLYHAPFVKLGQNLGPCAACNQVKKSSRTGTSVIQDSLLEINNADLANVQYHSYELLNTKHHLLPTSSGTYLITQPHSHPSIAFTGSNMDTDHIIVHTLPLQVSDNLNGHGTPMDTHVAINEIESEEVNSIDQVVSISELPLADQVDVIQTYTNGASESAIAASLEAEEQCQIIEQEAYSSQTISDITDQTLDGSEVCSSDLDMVSNGSPQYGQTTSNSDREIYMSTLSDPMLNSDSADLIATSDVENDKTNISDGNDS